MKATISIKEVAETVADSYGIHAKEIIKSRSWHKEARQVLMEISYLVNFRKKTLREMGQDLGGISGEQISQIHKLVQMRIKKDNPLKRRIEETINTLT